MKWIRNSVGKPDAMLTFSLLSVLAVLIKFLLSGVVVGKVALGTCDAATSGVILGATLGAYVARRNAIGVPPHAVDKKEGA